MSKDHKPIIEQFLPHPQMAFDPVVDDDDTLTDAIKADPMVHDDQWQLKDDIDSKELETFWDNALKELSDENRSVDE